MLLTSKSKQVFCGYSSDLDSVRFYAVPLICQGWCLELLRQEGKEGGREGHYALCKLTDVDPRDEAMAMLGSRGMMGAHLQGRQ